jgi:hypothetical protein
MLGWFYRHGCHFPGRRFVAACSIEIGERPMISRISATVVDGELKLDEPVPLPARTRVTVTIETVTHEEPRQAAWQRFERRLREHPLHLGGRDWSREDLYERD